MIRVKNACRANEGEKLRLALITKPQGIDGGENIATLQMLILLYPVDEGAVVDDHIDSVAKHLPCVVI